MCSPTDSVTGRPERRSSAAIWVPLEDAQKLLAYRGEKQMAKQALEYVLSHAEQFAER